jgi:hypothetical protein
MSLQITGGIPTDRSISIRSLNADVVLSRDTNLALNTSATY